MADKDKVEPKKQEEVKRESVLFPKKKKVNWAAQNILRR